MGRNLYFVFSLLILLTISTPLLALPDGTGAEQWPNMTVLTTSQQALSNVTVEWVNGGESLLVTRSDGAQKQFLLRQIQNIRDAVGQDRLNEILAARQAPNQKIYPSNRAAVKPPDPWRFNWTFGVGAGYLGTTGGSFPGSGGQWVLESGIRRRFYKNNYLKISSHKQDLATQAVSSFDGQVTTSSIVDWTEEQLFLSYGHYYEDRVWYWEIGVGALLRNLQDSRYSDGYENEYLKGGLRLEVGRMIPVAGHFAVDVAAYATFKPGFRDTRGGLAADIGLRLEVMTW